jgi:hypothetical protein
LSKEGTPNYKNIVSYGNKLLGFKLQPKTGQRIGVTRLAPADAYLHDITNKYIKALVTARKGEKASSWTIKHELQTLRVRYTLRVTSDITSTSISTGRLGI